MAYNFKYIYVTCIIIMTTQISSCGLYSFSGTSISENVRTFCVYYMKNNAQLIQPNLSNNLTEELKTKCLNETNLTWKDQDSDIVFSGNIEKYSIQPISIQNNETAAQNRLTIKVNITYQNKIDDSQNFKKTFSHYADFDSMENFIEIEDELNSIIISNLVEDIFNSALVNW